MYSAYFPRSGALSLTTALETGHSIETSAIDREGGASLLEALTGIVTTSRVTVQISGVGLQLDANSYRMAHQNSEAPGGYAALTAWPGPPPGSIVVTSGGPLQVPGELGRRPRRIFARRGEPWSFIPAPLAFRQRARAKQSRDIREQNLVAPGSSPLPADPMMRRPADLSRARGRSGRGHALLPLPHTGSASPALGLISSKAE